MSDQDAVVSGVAAGVPYVALPPAGRDESEPVPLIIAWHLNDPPRSAAAMAADLRAGCGVQRASSLVSSPETRRFMRWMLGLRYFDEPERLHLAGGGAQQPCRQAGDSNGQCGCRGDDREVDQR